MKANPILDELRRFRDAHAKGFNYDVAAICGDLERHRLTMVKQGVRFVKPPRRRTPRKLAA
jgi:hypothetical protein